MHLQESKRVLRQTDLFRDLNEIHLDLVLMVCEEVNYLGGEYIFRQDDPGDALYIIASGEIEVVLESGVEDEVSQHVTTLGEMASFGEMILVEEESQGLRAAGARCLTDTQLLRIEGERLLKLCYDYPEIGFRIMYRMAAELALKLRDSNLNIREQLFSHAPEDESEAETG
ncbi:MAG: cyclic nucleotide-binding domain-containing protein [Anaerolineae bacterium]|nr:cyclic nucleotide-binding domain-containing protein [Anaerolineae bacterium]